MAALLFKVDYAWQHGLTNAHKQACTSVENQWIAPTLKKLQPMMTQEMTVVKPHYHSKKRCPQKRKLARSLFSASRSRTASKAPTLEEFAEGLLPELLLAVALQHAFLDHLPQYAVESDVNVERTEECETTPGPPPPLTILATHHATADDLFDRLTSFTKEEVILLEEATCDQRDSEEWQKQRIGRVTASNAHRVLRKTKRKTTANESLLKSNMGQSYVNPNLPALKYGRVTESHAANAHIRANGHKNLWISKNGLFVLPDNAFLGASPD